MDAGKLVVLIGELIAMEFEDSGDFRYSEDSEEEASFQFRFGSQGYFVKVGKIA